MLWYLILLRLHLLRFSNANLQRWLINRNTLILSIFLRFHKSHKVRCRVLQASFDSSIVDINILNAICYLVKQDTINNVSIAQGLVTTYPQREKCPHKYLIDQILMHSEYRLERHQNLIKYRKFKLVKSKEPMLFDKSKMKMLEKVRQQLKKSIR